MVLSSRNFGERTTAPYEGRVFVALDQKPPRRAMRLLFSL
jgi:hypothetical protein